MGLPAGFFDFLDGYIYVTAWVRWFHHDDLSQARAERILLQWLRWCHRQQVHALVEHDEHVVAFLDLIEERSGVGQRDQFEATLADFHDWYQLQQNLKASP